MHIKGIVLDVGGVLVQTVDASKRRVWEEKLHLKPGQLSHIVYSREPGISATLGHVTSDTIWHTIQKRFHLPDSDLLNLKNDFYAADKLNKPFFDYMQSLKGRYPIVILSDAWDNAREMYTNKYHLDTLTNKMILSAEAGMKKPDDKFMQLALDYLGTKAEETMYIDDTSKFILHAKKAGMKTIYFVDTEKAIKEIESHL